MVACSCALSRGRYLLHFKGGGEAGRGDDLVNDSPADRKQSIYLSCQWFSEYRHFRHNTHATFWSSACNMEGGIVIKNRSNYCAKRLQLIYCFWCMLVYYSKWAYWSTGHPIMLIRTKLRFTKYFTICNLGLKIYAMLLICGTMNLSINIFNFQLFIISQPIQVKL